MGETTSYPAQPSLELPELFSMPYRPNTQEERALTAIENGVKAPPVAGDANGLARRQANRAVQADHFAVEHVIFNDVLGQLGVVLRCPKA